jgi:hypothetical protein
LTANVDSTFFPGTIVDPELYNIANVQIEEKEPRYSVLKPSSIEEVKG